MPVHTLAHQGDTTSSDIAIDNSSDEAQHTTKGCFDQPDGVDAEMTQMVVEAPSAPTDFMCMGAPALNQSHSMATDERIASNLGNDYN